MRYELLGTLRVVDGDECSFISAQKVATLLAVLLIHADHVVTAGQLMAELWGERLPKRAAAGLHVHIYETRKFLSRPDRRENPVVRLRSPGRPNMNASGPICSLPTPGYRCPIAHGKPCTAFRPGSR